VTSAVAGVVAVVGPCADAVLNISMVSPFHMRFLGAPKMGAGHRAPAGVLCVLCVLNISMVSPFQMRFLGAPKMGAGHIRPPMRGAEKMSPPAATWARRTRKECDAR
jgi:hypothetical protein